LSPVIFDSHCHAWRAWPYDATVPDPEHRGSIESLLYEMDQHGVDRAMVVCARIGDDVGPAWSNDDNNAYVDAAVRLFPDRLSMVADIDCSWRPEYHTAGAAARLQEAVDRYDLVGFTHYVRLPEDGWFDSDDGRAFFEVAAANDLLASIAAGPAWQPAIHRLAQRHPDLPILLHHQGELRLGSPTFAVDLAAVVAGAAFANIHVKASGFHYLTEPSWDYPYTRARAEVLTPLLDAFGPHRLLWGSDFPAARWHLTYTQSLEAFRSLPPLVGHPGLEQIMGGNLAELVRTRRPHAG
jgi:L-fuconolactonase